MSDLYYGLDFGACNIKVVKNQKGTLNKVKLFSGKANFLENVIYYQKNSDGSIETKLVFNAKQEAILYGDENTISNVKTKLLLKQWSKYIPNLGKDVSCEEAIYDIIDAIYKKIQLNRTDRSLEVITTITVPVAFSEVQKKTLKDICQKVGFTVRAVITEPFAALLSEDLDDVEGNQNILVFDFGGSTIDMSVVAVENEDDNILITEMASKGIVFGGLDIDDLIFDYITKTKYRDEYEEICSFVKEERVKHDLMESISSEKEDLFSDDYDLDDEDSNEMKIFYACSGNNKSYYFIVTATEINRILDENHCKDRIITALDELLGGDEVLDLRAGYYDKFYSIKSPYTTMKFLKNGRAISHFAKHYRGIILRCLALNGAKSFDELMEIKFPNLNLLNIIKTKLKIELIFEINGD